MPIVDNFRGIVVAPSSAKPPASQRRPTPRSAKAGCASKYSTRGAVTDADSKEELASAEEVARLQRTIGDLTRRCDSQSQELTGLRTRVQELEEQVAKPCQQVVVETPPPRICTTAQATQTEDSSELPATSRNAEVVESRDAHLEQLDAMHKEVGDKGRELRKAQESMRLLRRESEEQRLVAEQYRAQVEVLEEQLQMAMQKRRRGASPTPAARSAGCRGQTAPSPRQRPDPHRGEPKRRVAPHGAEGSDEESSDDCATGKHR